MHIFSEVGLCRNVKFPLCQNLPYNKTEMPNYFSHTTVNQAVASFNGYIDLIKSDCSAILPKYLCGLHFPRCSKERNLTKPCRSTCQTIKYSCEPELQKLQLQPNIFDCDTLPTGEECLLVEEKGNL